MASDQSAAAGSQPPSAGSQPPAQLVGNAFVQQYYQVLHQSPQIVHRFYQESSKLGRPDDDGVMDSVTTVEAINDKILAAMDYSEFRAEIKTVDAQESLNGGVTVLVTGYLIGKDLVKKDFTQSFFLAPQDKGYFVLNDMFRFVDEVHQLGNGVLANGTVVATLSSEQDSPPAPQEQVVQEQIPPSTSEDDEENGEEVYNPSEKEEDPAIVEEEAPVEEVIDEVPSEAQAVVADTILAIGYEEAPKKSYASIVKVMKENPAPLSFPKPAPARPAPRIQERHHVPAPPPVKVQAPELPNYNSTGLENNSVQEAEADGYSIYVKSLPLSATPAELEEEFKKFGPIKPGGIQVRIHKMQGFCFGFVEFEVASAVQSAIEASPVTIGGRQATVEEKRTTTTRANNRGRFAPGRGAGFHSDGVRGRGTYGSGRSYGRGDFGNRGGGRGGFSSRVGNVGPTGGRGSKGVATTPQVPASD